MVGFQRAILGSLLLVASVFAHSPPTSDDQHLQKRDLITTIAGALTKAVGAETLMTGTAAAFKSSVAAKSKDSQDNAVKNLDDELGKLKEEIVKTHSRSRKSRIRTFDDADNRRTFKEYDAVKPNVEGHKGRRQRGTIRRRPKEYSQFE